MNSSSNLLEAFIKLCVFHGHEIRDVEALPSSQSLTLVFLAHRAQEEAGSAVMRNTGHANVQRVLMLTSKPSLGLELLLTLLSVLVVLSAMRILTCPDGLPL